MRPLSLSIRGINRYTQADIDFTKIPGKIVAICGINGSGKTTLMESVFAALYRFFPSRPDQIYKFCHGNDAQIRLAFAFGESNFESLLNIDAPRRKMEAYLFNAGKEATPVIPEIDGKVGPYDTYIKAHFGGSSLILASSFASQGKQGSFTTLPKVDRKSLFISMLGQQRLERIASLASNERSAAEVAVASALGALDAARRRAAASPPDLEQIVASIDMLQRAATEANQAVNMASERLTILLHKSTGLEPLKKRYQDLEVKRSKLGSDISQCKLRLSEAERKAASVDSLRMMAEELKTQQAAQAPLRGEFTRLQSEQAEHLRLAGEYSEQMLAVERKTTDTRRSLDKAERDLKDAQRDSADISSVPCHAEGPCARCKYLVRAVSARDNLENFVGAVDTYKAQLLALGQETHKISRPDPAALTILEKQIKEMRLTIEHADAMIKRLEAGVSKLAEAEGAMTTTRELHSQVQRLEQDLDLLVVDLSAAESQVREAQQSATIAAQAKADLDGEKAALNGIMGTLQAKQSELAVAQAEIQAIEEAKKEVERLTVAYNKADQDRRSYELLSKAFGKTGIQSLEIDAAGPTVASIINDLLLSCFGPRFSVKLPTQRLSSSGSYVDEFDVYVYDSEVDREGSIDDLSGGEQVIVAEALSLGIALFNQQKSNVMWETLFRDEVSGALDDINAERYITMLRRAQEIGHFARLYFIAHQPRVMDLADNRINIKDQALEIC